MKFNIGGDSQVSPLPPENVPAHGARVDVYKTLDGTCKLICTDKQHPSGYLLEFTKDATIKIATDMLKSVGVAIIITGGAPPQ